MKKIIIFGASGDLAKRKIMPALSKVVGEDTQIYGYARSDIKKDYPALLRKFYDYSTDFPEKITYIAGKYDDLSQLKDVIDKETAIYFSIPPHVYAIVLAQLCAFEYGVICIEKPYGDSSETFEELRKYESPKIRFIDHYLLKPLILSLYELVHDNSRLFKLLNKQNIKSVECYFIESILAESRAYFDQNGIIKDLMQNHLIEGVASVLCLKPQKDYSIQRLDFIKKMKIEEEGSVFGQYHTYAKEMGRESKTETFAAFKSHVQNETWEGVPFMMAAGKGLHKKASEVVFNVKNDCFVHFSQFLTSKNNEIKIDEMSVIFNIAPCSEIYISIKSGNATYKNMVVSTEEIGKAIKTTVGAKADYEDIFISLISDSYFPTISFEEAGELWRLFCRINQAQKPLVHYCEGVEMPEEAIELFKKNK